MITGCGRWDWLVVRVSEQAVEKDPRHYIDEIRENVRKLQAQGQVTVTENALFHTIDGLAGVLLATMENVVDLKRRVEALETTLGATQMRAP